MEEEPVSEKESSPSAESCSDMETTARTGRREYCIKMWSEPNEYGKIGTYPKLDIMYRVSVNEFRGERSADCIIEHYRKCVE